MSEENSKPWEDDYTGEGAAPWDVDYQKQNLDDQVYDLNAQRAKDMSFGKAMLISTGREFDKLGSGTMDIFDSIMEKMGDEDATERRRVRQEDQANKDEMFAPLSDERMGATITGAVLPYLATLPAGVMASAGRGILGAGSQMLGRGALKEGGKWAGKRSLMHPTKVMSSAPRNITHMSQKSLAAEKAAQATKVIGQETALGTAEGAMHYDDTALMGGAMGLGGGIAGRYAGRILGGNPVKLGGEDARIVKFAKKHDQYVPPGMASGDAAVQQLDGALASHRKTANIVDDALADSYHIQNQDISNEIAKHYDDVPDAEVFSRDWLDNTKDSIGRRLDELTEAGQGAVDDDIALEALDVIDELGELGVSDEMLKPLGSWGKMFTDLADSGNKINGHEYQMIKDKLRKAAKIQRSQVLIGGGPIADALDKFSGLVDDAMENGVSGANKGAWKQTRRDWALVSALEKVKKKGKPIRGLSESGHVDARDLAKEFNSSELINDYADLQGLRMRQRRSSLSTSALLGRALAGATTGAPNDSMGSLMLMGSRVPGGDVLKVNEILSKLYMSGVPANTGIAPFLGRELTEPAFQHGVPRGLMSLSLGGQPELEDEQ